MLFTWYTFGSNDFVICNSQEHGDSLTSGEKKKKNRKKKNEDKTFLRPEGEIGELLTAIEKGNDALAKELIKKLGQKHPRSDPVWTADVDADSSTFLHLASRQNLGEIVW